jgi:bifunctional DNase/RNase
VRAAGTSVSEVRIVRLADMVFYAQVVLADGAIVDARPSDALNLALVTGVPILVEEDVLARAAETEGRLSEELAAVRASPRDAAALAEEGRTLLAEQRRRMDELRAR